MWENKAKRQKKSHMLISIIFIEGVMVHPLAPKWHVKIVKEFCFIKSMGDKLFGTAGANGFLPELADCKTVSLLLQFFALSL